MAIQEECQKTGWSAGADRKHERIRYACCRSNKQIKQPKRLPIYHHQVDAAQRTAKCPYRGQGREYSICSAKEYRVQGRENTEDKNGVLREQFNARKKTVALISHRATVTLFCINYQNFITIRCPIHQEKKSSSLHGRAALRWHLLRFRC